MADEIQARLVRWAEWLMRATGGGMGYPRECSYTRLQARSTLGFCSPEVDIESAETEMAVQSLPDHLKHAVQMHYLTTATRDQQARMLSCHVRTMERRLERAYILIAQAIDGAMRARRSKKVSTHA